jgi:hypothetical protein
MLVPVLTFTAIVGITVLCVGCAGRKETLPTAEAPVAVSGAKPPTVTADAAVVPPDVQPLVTAEPTASASTAAQNPVPKPAEPASIEKLRRSGDAISTDSPRTATAAKPAKLSSGKPTIAPRPPAQSAVADIGAQPLNLAALTLRLRNTSALGVFTKLSLKNEVDDLLDEFRAYHRHQSTTPLEELRRRYDSLLLEVLTRIQSNDPPLAADIASSREAIWAVLSDPKKFATI